MLHYSSTTGTWTSVAPGLPETEIRAVFTTKSGTILVAPWQHNMLFLKFGMLQWEYSGAFPILGEDQRQAHASFMQEENDRLWAATSYGILTSTDDGRNWDPRHNGLANLSFEGGITKTSTGMLIAGHTFLGPYRSTNNGDSWAPMDTVGRPRHVRAVASDLHGNVLIAAEEGLYGSTDGGNSFSRLVTGVRAESFMKLATLPSGRFVAFSEFDGMWFGTTSGGWAPMNLGFQGSRISSLRTRGNGELWAGSTNGWLFRTADGGQSWSRNTNLEAAYSNFIYDFCITRDNTVLLAAVNGVCRSEFPWQSWSVATDGPASQALLQASDGTIYSGVPGSTLSSSDDGATWIVSDTLPPDFYAASFVQLPNGAVLAGIGYGADGYGVRIRESSGAWRQFGLGLHDAHVSALCHSHGRLYAGTYQTGVFEYDSTDDTWHDVSLGLTNLMISEIIAGYSNDVYAATWGGGVFRKEADGPWLPVNTGLPNLHVIALERSTIGGPTLYAGTQGNGVFSTAIPVLTSTETVSSAASLQLAIPSPHPVIANSRVTFSLPQAGSVRIEVLNSLGRRVAVLHDATLPAGGHAIDWDASSFPNGIYLLRLAHNSGTMSRRCVVLR